jgi:glutamine amidotransferase-like uncharacterized protein
MAMKAGFDPVYDGANALNRNTTKEDAENLFRDAALWVQPGGKSSIAVSNMTSQLKDALKQFVREGGGYVGFCAGAFASTSWVGTTNYRGFEFMPGRSILYRNPRGADLIPITWNGKIRHIYWEGGPYLTELPEGKAEVIATYPNGQVASARSVYGRGKIFVTGLHPEAPQSWRDYYRMKDADGLDDDLAVEMMEWVTR